jgi:hypothetical protein
VISRPVFLAALVLNIRCGPLAVEAGRGILLSAPVAFLGTALVLALLLRLWRRRHPDLRYPVRALVIAGLVQLAAALMVLWPTVADGDFKWAGMGLWVFGCSYLTGTLVTWRIWLHQWPQGATKWAPLATMAFYWLPAVPLAAEWLPDSVARAMEPIWILPGLFGLTTAPLFIGLVIEAWLKNRKLPSG